MNQLINTKSIIFQVLLTIAALSSILFLFLPECYNGLSLDDIIFVNDLENISIWEYVSNMYLTWQGRYMGFLEHGIQYRIFGIFGSTIPYALLLYIIEISMLYSVYRMCTKWPTMQTLMVSVLTWGLFVMSMPDLSSYYWMCTKAYPLTIIMTVWLLAKIYSYAENKWYDWVGLIVSACFVGCSTEVFAPMILVLLGVRILKLWKQKSYRIGELIKDETVLCVVFLIAAINFFAMVFSPGTFIRMEVHSAASTLSLSEFISEICSSIGQITKMIFFKLHYYLAYFALMLALMPLSVKEKTLDVRQLLYRTIINILIAIGLFLLSMILCEWACGQAFITRAFSQLPATVYLLLFLLARDISRTQFSIKSRTLQLINISAIVAVCFVLSNNIYAACCAYTELEAYKTSEEKRMEILNDLQLSGNKEVVFLEPLDGAEYHSIMDDLWRKIMPNYSRIGLLKSNEVANDVEHCYNVAFRKYYKYDFDVISDLVYEGV